MNNRAKRQKIYISFGISLSLLIILQLLGVCLYESNDDMAMIGILSGRQGMPATPDSVFLSLPLSYILYNLYRLAINIPWYGITMYSALIFAGSAFYYIIFTSRIGRLAKIATLLSFTYFYIRIIAKLNFTGVALFLFFSAISVAAKRALDNSRPSIKDFLLGLLLAASYMIRPDIITFVVPFIALPAFISIILKKNTKRILYYFAPIILIAIISISSAKIYRANEEYKNYTEFNKLRSEFTDTSRSDFNPNTPAALDAVGWTVYDFNMANLWWLHDINLFNSSKLKSFLEKNAPQNGIFSLNVMKSYFKLITLPLILTFFVLLTITINKKNRKENYDKKDAFKIKIAILFMFISFFLLSAFRLPARVALPSLTFIITIFLITQQSIKIFSTENKIIRYFVNSITVVTISLSIYAIISKTYKIIDLKPVISGSNYYTRNLINTMYYKYGRDIILINSNSLKNATFNADYTNPLIEYNSGDLNFNNFPIGWLINSPTYNSFLKKHGFDRNNLVPQLINNNKIIFAFWESDKIYWNKFKPMFEKHLNIRYGNYFGGDNIKISVISDTSTKEGGWIFYKLVTD